MLYVRIIVGPMRLECLQICGVIQIHTTLKPAIILKRKKVLSQRQSKSQCTVQFNNGNKEQLWMNRYRWCSTPWWRPENFAIVQPLVLHSVMWAFTVSWPVGSHKSQWKCRFAKSQLNDSQATRNKTIGAEKKWKYSMCSQSACGGNFTVKHVVAATCCGDISLYCYRDWELC